MSADLKLFMARAADHVERCPDVLRFLDKIIAENSFLSSGARNILSVAYKALTGWRRNALRIVCAFLEDESIKAMPERIAELISLKMGLVAELDRSCRPDRPHGRKLLPRAADATTRLFYEKLKADYYHYSVEVKTDADRAAGAEKAQGSCERAVAIATAELGKADHAYLGLALNSSFFLYEIIGKRAEAIDLADKSFKAAVDLLDTLDETQYSEATIILERGDPRLHGAHSIGFRPETPQTRRLHMRLRK
jgi:14-3-3 protein epsilon